MKRIPELEKGHEHFKNVKFKKNQERFKQLVQEGQSPKILFIGCSDSRVMPIMITNSKPGDLFIVRNIGNFVPPFKPDSDFHATAAAIEYATGVLQVNHIVVCAHSDCGAIKAMYEQPETTPENIHTIKWLELGLPAKKAAILALNNAPKNELLEYTERLSVIYQLENLLTYPAVKRAVDEGEILLHGWHYNLVSGDIDYYDDEEMLFKPLGEK